MTFMNYNYFFSCILNPNGGVAKLSLKLRIDDHAPIVFMNYYQWPKANADEIDLYE